MDGQITGETDELIGLSIIDNNGVEHVLDVRKADGEITGHQQDGYPDDPAERDPIGHKHIGQARKFAKYWVHLKRGYDTLDLNENPHRIATVAFVMAGLDEEAFETLFGDLYRQVASHYSDVTRPVSLPEEAMPTHVTYQKDVYLGLGDRELASLAAALTDPDAVEFLMDLREGRAEIGTSIQSVLARLEQHSDHLEESLAEVPAETWIEAVSGIHVYWDDGVSQYHTQWGDQPDIDRDPDARLDLLPYDPASMAEFRLQLIRVLFCQVRDVYLNMGVAPPEPFRIQGHGIYTCATWYDGYDFYDRYHDPSAEITDWQEDATPDGFHELSPPAQDTPSLEAN